MLLCTSKYIEFLKSYNILTDFDSIETLVLKTIATFNTSKKLIVEGMAYLI